MKRTERGQPPEKSKNTSTRVRSGTWYLVQRMISGTVYQTKAQCSTAQHRTAGRGTAPDGAALAAEP